METIVWLIINLITTICLISEAIGCKPLPEGGIIPTSQVQTSSGANNTLNSETFHNSIKTVATINLSGHIGGLVIFCVIFILLITVYKKLSEYLSLVNDRLHSLAALFGIHGFAVRDPAIQAPAFELDDKC